MKSENEDCRGETTVQSLFTRIHDHHHTSQVKTRTWNWNSQSWWVFSKSRRGPTMTSACVFERMHCFSKKIACYLIRNCSPTENEFKNLTINRSYFFFYNIKCCYFAVLKYSHRFNKCYLSSNATLPPCRSFAPSTSIEKLVTDKEENRILWQRKQTKKN